MFLWRKKNSTSKQFCSWKMRVEKGTLEKKNYACACNISCKYKDRYLRVKFASVVQECHADFLQPTYLAGVILKALKHAAADIPCTHQAVLDLSWKERTGYSEGPCHLSTAADCNMQVGIDNGMEANKNPPKRSFLCISLGRHRWTRVCSKTEGL